MRNIDHDEAGYDEEQINPGQAKVKEFGQDGIATIFMIDHKEMGDHHQQSGDTAQGLNIIEPDEGSVL